MERIDIMDAWFGFNGIQVDFPARIHEHDYASINVDITVASL